MGFGRQCHLVAARINAIVHSELILQTFTILYIEFQSGDDHDPSWITLRAAPWGSGRLFNVVWPGLWKSVV